MAITGLGSGVGATLGDGTTTYSQVLSVAINGQTCDMTGDSSVADWPESRMWLLTNALEYIMAQPNNHIYSLHQPEFMEKVYTALGDTRASYTPIKVNDTIDNKELRIRDCYLEV